jgi:DNA polymerase elongation subunit (family B)
MLFLWNVGFIGANREIRLEFYDSSSQEIRRFNITDYEPYFLAPYPMSKDGEEAMSSFQGEMELVQKRNLFTEETMRLAKVKAWTPALLKKIHRHFDVVWESEVEYGRSFIYDKRLVFGAPYEQRGDSFAMVNDVPNDLKQPFEAVFEQERKSSPLKHAQTEFWFDLCNQPVPEVDSELLGGKKEQEETVERVYLAFLLARIANLPVPETYASRRVSDWIKSMIYTALRKNNILIPTSKELRRGLETHMVPGALTIEPEMGIYFNTIVCDFESLYPSCIDSYNLSYETVDCPHEECTVNKISEVGHHVCTKRKGFYSILIGALKDLRIRWFKPLSNNTSTSEEERRRAKAAERLLKLISVSSYGVTVRIHGLACPPLAESITGYGRWALQTTWNTAKEMGMHPTYGDTDSIFLDNPPQQQVQALIDAVKKRLNLDLAIERRYAVCVLPKAKKAYFGITRNGTPDLKGLTAIKSNAPKFIQRVFRDCIQVLSNVKNMEQYVLAKEKIVAVVYDATRRLSERNVDLEDLVYSVQLYYDPTERLSSTDVMPQPYQCAIQLLDAGEKLSRRDTVHFVKVKPFAYRGKTFTVKPVDHVKSLAEINVEDYVRNLTTALGQTFKPMNLKLKKEVELTDWFNA